MEYEELELGEMRALRLKRLFEIKRLIEEEPEIPFFIEFKPSCRVSQLILNAC